MSSQIQSQNVPKDLFLVTNEVIEELLASQPLIEGNDVIQASIKLWEESGMLFPRIVRKWRTPRLPFGELQHRPCEVHRTVADVWQNYKGTALFVRGGTLVKPYPFDDETIFGIDIEGGEDVVVGQGEHFLIPAGQAHTHYTYDDEPVVILIYQLPDRRATIELPDYLKDVA